MGLLTRLSRNARITIGMALAVILFVALNVLASNLLRGARIDLTAQQLYTLSDGTGAVLDALDEPVNLRLFLSSNLVDVAPTLATYAGRVREMLAAYQRRAGDRLRVEVIDPPPFSDAEDRAVGLGVSPMSVGDGQSVFFGLAGTNSTDGQGNIPVFSPEREAFLEYDLTRLIAELGQRGKPVLTVLDGLGLFGNPMTRQPEQQLIAQARQFFDVKLLPPDSAGLPEGTRVLMLVHPQNLSPALLYAIDQWVLAGGASFVFVDPYAETQQGLRPNMPPPDPSSDLQPLFGAWGLVWEDDKAIGDPVNALRSSRPSVGGREIEVPTVQWLGLREDSIVRNHPELAGLNAIFLTTAGRLGVSNDKLTLDPLLIASAQAGTVNAAAAGDPGGDPRALLAGIKPLGMRPVLGARIRGEWPSAYPDGPPEGVSATQAHLAAAKAPPNVVVIGDADMLMDRNWIRRQQVLGQTIPAAFANNGDFVLNLAEQLAGGVSLADLRGRGISYRPFERIAALQRDAQARYLDKEQALTQRLRDTETRLAELSRQAGENAALLSDEGARAIGQFRADLLATRAELRDVQFNLKSDVEQLKARLTALNVAGVPAIVAALALVYALRRRRAAVPRAARPSSAGQHP